MIISTIFLSVINFNWIFKLIQYDMNNYINKENPRDLIAATGLLILRELDSNIDFSARVNLKFGGLPWKITGQLFILYQTLCINAQLELVSWDAQLGSKSVIFGLETLNSGIIWPFFSHVTLKFDGWPWKTTGHIYVASIVVHYFIAISEFKLKLQSGNPQFGSKLVFFCPVRPRNWTDNLEKQ